MENEEFLKERKQRWISRLYYHIAASPNCNLHPFKNILDFLNARVGDMVWGKDERSRSLSKTKFAQSLERVFELYNIHVSESDLIRNLSNDQITNYDLVQKIAVNGYISE